MSLDVARSSSRQLATWLLAGLATVLLAPATAADDPPARIDEGYLEQLLVQRDESRLQRDLRELRTYPHMDRAYRLLNEGRLDEARVELERSLSLDTHNLETRYAFLVLMHRLADRAEVVRQATILLEARPGFVPALLYRGLAYLDQDELELAEGDLQTAAAASTATAEDRVFALETWADVALRQQRYESASTALDQLEALAADSFDIHFMRGLSLDGAGRVEASIAAFRQALQVAQQPGESLRAHRALGEAALKLEDWEAAEEALAAASQLDPRDPGLHRGLAHVALRLDRHRQAADRMRSALDLETRPQDLEFLANALFLAGDLDGAARTFDRLLEEDRSPAERYRTFVALGHVLERLSRFGQATEAFSQAAQLRDDPEALEGLARALERSGRLPEAIDAYRRLASRRPGPESLYYLGIALAKAGEHEAAIRHLRLAASQQMRAPLQVTAYRQLGFLEARLERHEAALSAFEEALALGPDNDAELLFALGETCNRLGRFDRAIPFLERGLQLGPNPAARRALAWAHAGAGNSEKAAEIYRELVAVPSPESGPAVDILAELANLELELGETDTAADLFTEALGRHSTPSPELMGQAATSLARASRWEEALSVNSDLLELPELDSDLRAAALERQAEFLMRLERPESAAGAWRAALVIRPDDERLHQALGFAEFELNRWDESLKHFRRALELDPSPQTRLHLARCYDQLGKPGTALHHLKQVAPELERLEETDRRAALEELGHLNAQQAAHDAAAEAWAARLELAYDPQIALRYGATLTRLGRAEQALSVLLEIEPDSLPPEKRATRLDLLAELAMASGEISRAAGLYLQAQELAPSAARLYHLGLSYQALDEPQDALEHLRSAAAAAPAETRYREAVGYAFAAVGRIDEAIETFEAVVSQDPDYLSVYQDLGYLYLRQSDAPKAVEWFQRAIDNRPLYPVHTEEEEAELEHDIDRMRQEVSKLANRFDFTLYLAARADTLPSTSTPALGGGVLPSQGGVELAFLPPRVGFRNERVFQIFGRVLANARPGTLDLNEESYQGGLGARYKPFRSQNLYFSGERLFEIGDDSQDNWLLRALYSWDRGYALRPGRARWNYTFVFLDAGWFVEAPSYWAFFGELRQGLTFNLDDRFLLTPHLLFDGRYQDPGGPNSSYVEVGGGLSLKLFYGGGRYQKAGGALELLMQYRFGRFVDQQRQVTNESFDGFVGTAVFQF